MMLSKLEIVYDRPEGMVILTLEHHSGGKESYNILVIRNVEMAKDFKVQAFETVDRETLGKHVMELQSIHNAGDYTIENYGKEINPNELPDDPTGGMADHK